VSLAALDPSTATSEITRAPAAPVVAAAMAGILLDRGLDLPTSIYGALLGFAILAGLGVVRSAGWGTVIVLGGWSGLFGLWHHTWWADPPSGDVFHVATDAGLSVSLRGRVVEPSWLQFRDDGEPETLAVVACEALDQSEVVTGTARLQILRTDSPLPAGAVIRVVGRLQRPPPAANWDGFDYRHWLRMRGVTALLRAESADAVVVDAQQPTWWNRIQNSRHALRESAVAALQQARYSETAAIGEALLLGSRGRLPDEIREAFAESGVLHVLAISGVNVAVIWLGLIRTCRGIGLSLTASGWAVIAGLMAYAWLTDANPPIVRAATFAIVLQAAELSGRQVGLLQGLSLAALVVLGLNPTDLFNAGAQLSFVSVAVLAAVNRACESWNLAIRDELPDDESPWRSSGRWLRTWFWQANFTTGAVWLATAPLVAWRFHLVSLVGIGLNVLLGPWVLLLLWSGYLWLVTFLIYPLGAGWLLHVFEGLLQGLLWTAQLAAAWPYGHWYLPGPPGWWVVGFYGWLAAVLLLGRRWPRVRQLESLLLWTNLGLTWGLWPAGMKPLVCDVIAVGHGLAVVIHCPNGRTLGYDVGCLAGGDYAAAGVCENVWQTGSRRLDALIVSHADADHCNGVPATADRLSVGTLCVHRNILADEPPVVRSALEAWSAAGGPIRLVAAGDQIGIDPNVRVTVWQPAANVRFPRDNANSLVVQVEYAGRKILLTGDLERDGLAALLQRPRSPVDLLVAPHHGSMTANPPELAAWASPSIAIASSADRQAAARLAESYREPTLVLNTAESGGIRCEIHGDGQWTLRTVRGKASPE
jgi:competence protein ComEC